MGVVYRAERLKLGRAVAIKVMHESLPEELGSLRRFEIEAKAMAQLEHPHCVPVFDAGIHDGKPYIVMELVRGDSLFDLIQQQGRFDIARTVNIARQVLSGLTHAHELGIVHRDIKPANLVVGHKAGLGEHVRILDFGLARSSAHSSGVTAGFAVGTPSYMAPEQCCGAAVDARTDLYAVGVVMFELLTGRKPFVAEDPIEIVKMHLSTPPPRIDSVVREDFGELENVIATALAKAPIERYASATEMSAALDAAFAKFPAHISQSLAIDPADIMSSEPIRFSATVRGLTAPAPPPDVDELGQPRPKTIPPRVPTEPRPQTIPPRVPSEPRPQTAPPRARSHDDSGTIAEVQTALRTDRTKREEPVATQAKPRKSPRGLVVAGVVVAGLGAAAAIVLVANSGSPEHEHPHDAGVATAASDASEDPAAPIIARAEELASEGRPELALDLVNKARRNYPTSPGLPYEAGKLAMQKLYFRDGFASFREAIKLDPSLRNDPELIKAALRAFIVTPDYNELAADFLHDEIGPTAAQYLEETSKAHPNARVRARASAELRRYHP
jgi:serine/threonine protein kinase